MFEEKLKIFSEEIEAHKQTIKNLQEESLEHSVEGNEYF